MKAWRAEDKYNSEGYSTVVFAETASKAKAIALYTDACEDANFTDIRVTRIKDLDGAYRGLSELDWEHPDDRIAMVKHGWHCLYPNEDEKCTLCPASAFCDSYQEYLKETEEQAVKELASRLNGSEYGCEVGTLDEIFAKDNGLVIVHGYSDDNVELRGAVSDELDCYDGGEFWINNKGEIAWSAQDGYKKIECVWCGPSGASWEYRTDIPHETFRVYEDGELYCVGIVFDLLDV